MHQEVRDLATLERAAHRIRITEIALDDLDVVRPGHVAQSRAVAHEHAHVVTAFQKPGSQAPAQIPGGAGQEDAHAVTLGLRAEETPGLHEIQSP